MEVTEREQVLRRVPLFSGLSDANLRRVAETAREVTFRRGSALARIGHPGQAFYYILSGEALTRALDARKRMRPVGYLRAGSFFGITSLLLGEPHDASIEAMTDVTALTLDRDEFRQLLHKVPGLRGQLRLPEEIQIKLRHERFPWLDADEVVVFIARRHWFVFLRSMLLPTLVAVLVGILIFALGRYLGGAGWVALTIPLLMYVALFIGNLIDWRNDYFVVTTERVVHREFVLYQYEEARHEAPLTQIQDVNVDRDFWANLLGFGTVLIETAAHSQIGRIIFDRIPNPDAAKDIIFQQIYRVQGRTQMVARQEMRRELKRRLGWITVEELEAEGKSHIPPPEKPPAAAPRGWLARLARFRILPPLRIEQGDRITWRKHWVFLVLKASQPALASLLLIVLFIIYLVGYVPSQGLNLGVFLGFLVAGLAVGFWLWWQIVDWENDIYVLTDERIIDIEKKPLFFSEQRREATLDRIQNVNLSVPGPWAAILNYGDVNIDTAGGEGEFTFTHVVAPHTVQRDIMSRVARQREQRQRFEAQQRRREVIDWLKVYEDLQREQKGPPAGPAPLTRPPSGR